MAQHASQDSQGLPVSRPAMTSAPSIKPRGHVSLQRQLIVNVGLLTILGLGSVTGWAALQMQRQLVGIHKQNLDAIAMAFPVEIEARFAQLAKETAIDSGLVTASESIFVEMDGEIQQTIEEFAEASVAPGKLMIWLRDDQQDRLLAQSALAAQDPLSVGDLAAMTGERLFTRLMPWGDRQLLVCHRPISIDLGENGDVSSVVRSLDLYLAHDVTQEHQQIVRGLRQLLLADLIVTLVLVGAIAHIVRRGLAPLARINGLAQELSASDLAQTRLAEDQAPEEIAALVEGFNAMLGRLALAWQKQRQFVNDASHELRTPLAIVDGYLQSVLRRRKSLTPLQLEAITTASEETQRTIQMLEEMLTIARADNGQLSFELSHSILQPLLMEVVERTGHLYERQVILESPEEPVAALVDTQYLQQVLSYLVENAVKYSDAHSSVVIRLSPVSAQNVSVGEEGRVALEPTRGSDAVAIAVIDQGIGIPLEQQRCIFERFYRADEARHRKGGTGLGLALAKTLIEGMGGEITVASVPGQGSTFTLKLPP